jgi:hypothetical protein
VRNVAVRVSLAWWRLNGCSGGPRENLSHAMFGRVKIRGASNFMRDVTTSG